MRFHSLQQFVDLAATRHFSRTSAQHHVSPSTLSRSIQRLEDAVGCQLVERSNRAVTLTREGEQFLLFARETLQRWSALRHQLHESGEQLHGEVSLYCSVTASHSLLSVILADLREVHSGIDIKLHTGDQADSLDRLLAGHDDFAIAAYDSDFPSTVLFRKLAQSKLVLIVPRSSCSVRHGVDAALYHGELSSLFEIPWILPERGLVRARLDAWTHRRNLQANVYAQVAGHEALVSMVGLGCGIGIVPELVLKNSPVRDAIESVEAGIDLADFEIGLCVLESRLDSALVDAVWRRIPAVGLALEAGEK